MSTDEEEEDVYIVERIDNKTIKNGEIYYLIKWEGYEERTWEPEENIIDKELIDEFNKRYAAQRKQPASFVGPNSQRRTSTAGSSSSVTATSKLNETSAAKPKPKTEKKQRPAEDKKQTAAAAAPSSSTHRPAPRYTLVSDDDDGDDETEELDIEDRQTALPTDTPKSLSLDFSSEEDGDASEAAAAAETLPSAGNSLAEFSMHAPSCDVCGKRKPKPSGCEKCTNSIHAGCARLTAKNAPSPNASLRCAYCAKQDPSCAACRTSLLENEKMLFYRCVRCNDAFHPQCIASYAEEVRASFQCANCFAFDANIQTILTWRRKITEEGVQKEISAAPSDSWEGASEREYFVKFDGKSFRACRWVPEAWLAKVASQRLKAFVRAAPASAAVEDVRPEDVCRIERILSYRSVAIGSSHPPQYKMQALVKWHGVPYAEATWETQEALQAYDAAEWADRLAQYKRSLTLFKGWSVTRPPAAASSFVPFVTTPSFVAECGTLMPHQLEGLNWLTFNWMQQQNVLLADEMGLGKTVQTLAFLVNIYRNYHCFPFLIVAPTSVCDNWAQEIAFWAPDMCAVVYGGTAADRQTIADYELFNCFIPKGSSKHATPIKNHVIIASFQTVTRDAHVFQKIAWECVIVDEAHRLKGTGNQLSDALGTLRTRFKLLLTGTPIQNNIRELFNVLKYIAPNVFTQLDAMEKQYEDFAADASKIAELHALLRPLILRRTKADVKASYVVPPKAEVIVPVTMAPFQRVMYRSIVERNYAALVSRLGASAKRISMLNILMELRKCANHPLLCTTRTLNDVADEAADWSDERLIGASGKLLLLDRLLPALMAKGHRVLVFSQMTRMLDVISAFLAAKNVEHVRIDGSTHAAERQRLIDAFNADIQTADESEKTPEAAKSRILDPKRPHVFLLSTRAGGLGVNLQSADAVIIYDSDFNPHQDVQACSRAHRFGQTRPVVVYKLLTLNSVEEKIAQIANKKLLLDHVVVDRMADGVDESNGAQLSAVLACGTAKLFDEEAAKNASFSYDDEMIDELTNFDRLIEKFAVTDGVETQLNAAAFGDSFKFAKIWEVAATNALSPTSEDAKLEGAAADGGDCDAEAAGDEAFWSRLLKNTAAAAAASAVTSPEELGVGKRKRKPVESDDVTRFLFAADSSPNRANSGQNTELEDDSAKTAKRPKEDDAAYEPPNGASASSEDEFVDAVEDRPTAPVSAAGPSSNVDAKAAAINDSPFNFASKLSRPVVYLDVQKLPVNLATAIQQSNFLSSAAVKSALLNASCMFSTASNEPENRASPDGYLLFVVSAGKLHAQSGFICMRFNLRYLFWNLLFLHADDIAVLRVVLAKQQAFATVLASKMMLKQKMAVEEATSSSSLKLPPLAADRRLLVPPPFEANASSSSLPELRVVPLATISPQISVKTFPTKMPEAAVCETAASPAAKLQPMAGKAAIPVVQTAALPPKTTALLPTASSFVVPPKPSDSLGDGPAPRPSMIQPLLVTKIVNSEPKGIAKPAASAVAISSAKQSPLPLPPKPDVSAVAANQRSASPVAMHLDSCSIDDIFAYLQKRITSLHSVYSNVTASLASLSSSAEGMRNASSASLLVDNEILRQQNEVLRAELAKNAQRNALAADIDDLGSGNSNAFSAGSFLSDSRKSSKWRCEWETCPASTRKRFEDRQALMRHILKHHIGVPSVASATN